MLNKKEQDFIDSIQRKISKFKIRTTLKEAIANASNVFINTTYNDKTEEIVDAGIERFLCSLSAFYFIKRYCYISLPNVGIIPFDLYYYQEEVLKEIMDYKKYVFLKSRQTGISTLTSFYCLWRCIFRQGEDIAIVSKKKDAAQDFITKMKVTLDYLPDFLKPEIEYDNMGSIGFKNNSRIKSEARSSNAGRSGSLSLLVLDEAAFYGSDKMAREIIASAMPTLTRTGGSLIIVSCYTADTWINTENGLEQIKDYIPANCISGYNKIPPFKIDGLNHQQITDTFYDSGITPIKEIILNNKTNLKVSEIHPIYILGEDGLPVWRQAKDVKIGDKALFSTREKTFGEDDYIGFNWLEKSKNEWQIKYKLENFDGYITEDMAYFFGLLIGDGYFNKKGQNVIITNIDKEIKDFLFNNKHFRNTYLEKREEDECHYRIQGKYLLDLLNYIGFQEVKAKEKIIPKRLLKMSRQNLIALLQGLFDSDGHSRHSRGNIGFTSTSPKLIEQIKMILSMFGIYVGEERWSISKPTKKVKVESLVCQIHLSNYFSKLFYEKIGFRIKRKQSAYFHVKNTTRECCYKNLAKTIRKSYSNIDIANTLSRDIRRGWKHLSKVLRDDANPKSLKYYLDYFDGILSDTDFYKQIKDFYEKEFYPVEIIEIKDGKEHTYDFVIPETRSLYANSIIGSNTPNGMHGEGSYFFEQVQQLKSLGNTKTSKLVEIEWYEVPDIENVYPQKGYNTILQNFIVKDYYRNPSAKKELKEYFKPIEAAWKENEWLRIQYQTLGEVLFKQEILHDFITTGSSVFSKEVLDKVFLKIKEPVIKNTLGTSSYDGLWMWKPPTNNHRYILCADVATGTGDDFSAIQVFDAGEYEQVAEYYGHISTPNFAILIKKLASYYNQGYVVIESNSIGEAVFNQIYYDDYEPYRNVFKQEKSKNGITRMTGWITDVKSRKLIVNELIDWLTVDDLWNSLKLYSARLHNELSTWIWEKGKAIHTGSAHDDLLIAMSLALYLRNKAASSGASFIIDEKGRLISSEKSEGGYSEDGFYGILADGMGDMPSTIEEQYGMDIDTYGWLSCSK